MNEQLPKAKIIDGALHVERVDGKHIIFSTIESRRRKREKEKEAEYACQEKTP